MKSGLQLICRISNQGSNPNNWQLGRRLIAGRLGAGPVMDGYAPVPRAIHSVQFGTATCWGKSWEVVRGIAASDPKALLHAQTDPNAVTVNGVKVMPNQQADVATVPQDVLDQLDEDDFGFVRYVGIGN